MNDDPKDLLFPKGLNEELEKPNKKEEKLTPLKKLNKSLKLAEDDEKKRKIGIIITTLIILTLIVSCYYFLIYEPSQEELSVAKTTKLNELHELYSGPLVTNPNAILLENRIEDGKNAHEVEHIDILTPASKDWKSYHKKSIGANTDKYNRTMLVWSNDTKDMLMPASEAIKVVNKYDARVLSKISFEKVNTVSVPILVSRLQAGAGLISVGSIVDIYSSINQTINESGNDSTPNISGCTVLSIMRYEESGEIDAEYSRSDMYVDGNLTYPSENTRGFSSNVLEMIKGAIIDGYSEEKTYEMLESYGVKLSNYERVLNLGDLDAQYMILVEVPQDKVNFIINNMDNIVLTIPTANAPDWMINEINMTYEYSN